MANAVFSSLEEYYRKNQLRPNVPYSKFDLSHIRNQDMDFGILTPFYLEDCVPGDRFRISQVAKIQALPLKNPLFNRIKLSTYFFFVPYYLLWRHFDRFIEGGRDGTYTAELPWVGVTSGSDHLKYTQLSQVSPIGSNTLWDYLGFQNLYVNYPSGTVPKVSAFPFAAYQRIFRDYFFDQDVQTSTNVNEWFPEDDFDFVLSDGVNYALGGSSWSTPPTDHPKNAFVTGNSAANNTSAPWLLFLHTKNFNRDYFTAAKFSPQRGPAQAVPTYFTASLDFSNSLGSSVLSNHGVVQSVSAGTSGTSRLIATDTDLSTFQSGGTADIAEALNRGKINVSSSGFTLADLHLAQQIEIWMERNMSVKAQYNEFLRIHFNDAPIDERLTKPYYIGGNVQDIYISEVLQTSETNQTAQGTATGHASSFDSGFIGSFHCHEYGLIMGIACIMPESYYNSGIDRHWTKTTRYDFYFPEFADLEPQAVMRQEIFFNFGTPANPVFGYQGRYDEYRFHRSLSVGCFRPDGAVDFSSWVIPRSLIPFGGNYLSAAPTLNNSFINSHYVYSVDSSPAFAYDSTAGARGASLTTISHDAWASGTSVNPFIVQFGLSITAVRPMPFISDPTRIPGGK